MKIEGSVIIVTGASAGIGQATAAALARAGAHVVLSARRAELLQQLARDWQHLPGRRLVIAGDISQEEYARELVEQTVREFGRLDVLVNNAGIGQYSHLADFATADIQAIWDTNVMALIHTSQAAIVHFKRQQGGQIINVSSILGQRPLIHSSIYCASKTAVNFISRSLRMELQPHQITVTLVYPGATATEFHQARRGQAHDRHYAAISVKPERVARAIVKAIKYGRTEVYVTGYDWLFTHLNRLFPRTFDWLFRMLNL
jgi:short-subunit dehydrogenase